MNKLIIEASCEVDGVEYHAESRGPQQLCFGCSRYEEDEPCLPQCGAVERADRSDVIWVRAE